MNYYEMDYCNMNNYQKMIMNTHIDGMIVGINRIGYKAISWSIGSPDNSGERLVDFNCINRMGEEEIVTYRLPKNGDFRRMERSK